MKTQTRNKILQIIHDNDGTRPKDLVETLGITPQAIHRHLRHLVENDRIISQGRGSRTRYYIAGKPKLNDILCWASSSTEPEKIPAEKICQTRDIFTARLSHFEPYTGQGLKLEDLSLVISIAGEVGNNCFDHNLGKWIDIPGCWFEIQLTAEKLWICIADRGQGILRSLSRADISITDDQTALVSAFEKTISGRFPENRGNGLKYVKKIITAKGNRGLACRSGKGLVEYGALGKNCCSELRCYAEDPVGTLTVMAWSLK